MPDFRVLVVEDDPATAELLKAILADSGFAVSVASSALEMAHHVERADLNLILLDIDLPDGDGLELLSSLRQHSWIPVIMVTGSTSSADRLSALELGADDYVTKPFKPRELIARCRAVLRRSIPSLVREEVEPVRATG
ncbi:MAG: response regulator transcription factor [Alphaproteobacteria bacterium]|nr:response regulator transcription factor [Alphaproteobacteria bacterium SS10]